jgi:nucleoid-associated protein YgaU
MSLQEKYQSILELANSNGTTYELSEADGVLHINGTAPNAEAKQALWDEYQKIDPDLNAGDLILDIKQADQPEGGQANTYTVVAGDNLSKIGAKYGISWKALFDANRDILDNPDLIQPGQELKIPG